MKVRASTIAVATGIGQAASPCRRCSAHTAIRKIATGIVTVALASTRLMWAVWLS